MKLGLDVRVCRRWIVAIAAGIFAYGGAIRNVSAQQCQESSQTPQSQTTAGVQANTTDWMQQVRERVAAHDLAGAQKIVAGELEAAPNDSDALGWRAQLLIWTGHHTEAEAVYRHALEVSPRDGDFLLGLGTLLAQDGRNADALALLNIALAIPPPRADVYNERGRVLAALKRRNEARADFLKAKSLEPAAIAHEDDEAAADLHSLELPPRFEVDFTNETDTFNYTGAANAQIVTFVAKPNERWIFSTEANSYQRFGTNAQKVIAAAAYRLDSADSVTIAAGAGNAQGIIPRTEMYFEYDRGFRISENAPLRGLETTYNQHWLWYQGAHVLVLTGTVAADLAHDVRWTISANGARSQFAGTPVAWEPSGYARLDFPVPHVGTARLLPNVIFAVGSENFSELDQVSAFASRTCGSGFRLGITERQFVNFYFAWQNRNGGNSEGIYGLNYGIRF